MEGRNLADGFSSLSRYEGGSYIYIIFPDALLLRQTAGESRQLTILSIGVFKNIIEWTYIRVIVKSWKCVWLKTLRGGGGGPNNILYK
jgi:hypothetical protein